MITLVKTKDLSHKEWLEYRKKGIGGSDAGAICGLSKWKSPIDVFLDKTSNEVDDFDSLRLQLGRDLEPIVASYWEKETGKKCRRRNAILQHEEYPFMLANIDRWVEGENAGLELKTGSSYVLDQWKDGAIPPTYEIQCMHYMAVTGAERWYLVCLIGNTALEYRTIERDETAIQNLIKIEKDFWQGHVEKNIMPPPDGSDAAGEAIKLLYPDVEEGLEIDAPDMEESMHRYLEINDLVKRLEDEKKQIQQEMQVRMEEAETAFAGDVVATWKKQKGRVTVDSKRLQVEKPDVYAAYTKEGAPYRVFRVKQYQSKKTQEAF